MRITIINKKKRKYERERESIKKWKIKMKNV